MDNNPEEFFGSKESRFPVKSQSLLSLEHIYHPPTTLIAFFFYFNKIKKVVKNNHVYHNCYRCKWTVEAWAVLVPEEDVFLSPFGVKFRHQMAKIVRWKKPFLQSRFYDTFCGSSTWKTDRFLKRVFSLAKGNTCEVDTLMPADFKKAHSFW